jgi:hypothetical protein
MIRIRLKELNNPDKWVVKNYEGSYVYVRGYLYYNNKLFKGNALTDLIQKFNFNDMLLFAKNANGFFCYYKER